MSIRSEISNAYYDARNAGRTMESAADDAAARVTEFVAALLAQHGWTQFPDSSDGWGACLCDEWEQPDFGVSRDQYDAHIRQVLKEAS